MSVVIEINVHSDKVEFSDIQRVLVIKLQHLGDVLLTTPVFSTLKLQYPHLQVDALIYQETLPILNDNPYIHSVHVIDRNWKKQSKLVQVQSESILLRQLRSNKYDLIINLSDRWRGAWLVRLLQPRYSVSLPYAHRRGRFWRRSFTHIYRILALSRHAVERNLDAIRRVGVMPTQEQKKLTFFTNQDDEDKVKRVLKGRDENKPLVVVHPTSRWMFKTWNPEGFAEVIDTLTDKGYDIVLISGPAEMEIAYVEAILQKSKNKVISLAGQLTLAECGAIIKLADCFLGLDSVAMHIAAAVNTPCAALFGPTKEKVWSPWMVDHRIISAKNFDCRPCELKGCGDGMVSECIQVIEPELVVQAIDTLIKN